LAKKAVYACANFLVKRQHAGFLYQWAWFQILLMTDFFYLLSQSAQKAVPVK